MTSLPSTLLLQGAVAMVLAAVGVLGLGVARRASGAPTHGGAWRLIGAAFLLMGLNAIAQNVFGAVAILEGPGSGAWDAYLRWSPAINHSRNMTELAMLGLLLLAASVPRFQDALRGGWRLLPLAMAAGGALGWLEGPLLAQRHYLNVAFTDALNFAVWSVTLSAAVLADVVDRWLLLALAICAVQLPLNSLWFFWMARLESGAWIPRPLDMQLYRLAVDLAVLGVVLHRWRLARAGAVVDGLGGNLPARAL